MNEKIKELIEQAGTDISEKWMSTEQCEKFAESIIEECYLVVVSNPHIGTSLAGRRMKEHFGVE
jgi:hypothetical protein